jgi:hypothetical protein
MGVFAGTERQCTEDEHDDEDEHDSQISESAFIYPIQGVIGVIWAAHIDSSSACDRANCAYLQQILSPVPTLPDRMFWRRAQAPP